MVTAVQVKLLRRVIVTAATPLLDYCTVTVDTVALLTLLTHHFAFFVLPTRGRRTSSRLGFVLDHCSGVFVHGFIGLGVFFDIGIVFGGVFFFELGMLCASGVRCT